MSLSSPRRLPPFNEFKSKPPAEIYPDRPDPATKKVLAALSIIRDILERNFYEHLPTEDSSLIRNWPVVSSWILIIFRGIVQHEANTVEGVDLTFKFVHSAATVVAFPLLTRPKVGGDARDLRKLQDLLLSTPSLLQHIAGMWSYTILTGHPARNLTVSVFVLSLDALSRLEQKPEISLDLLMNDSQGSYNCVGACAAILRMHYWDSASSQEDLQGACKIVLSFMDFRPEFIRMCVDNGLLHWSTVALIKLLRHPIENDDLDVIDGPKAIVATCLDLYPTLVLDTLNTGVLRTILRLSPDVSKPAEINKFKRLLEGLDYYLGGLIRMLIYRPIAVRVVRDFLRVDREHADYLQRLRRFGELSAKLVELRDSAFMRWKIEKLDSRPASMICENVTCSNVEPVLSGKTFKRCSGCGQVVYCSKECQRYAWKESHRRFCKDYQSRSQAFSSSISMPLASLEHLYTARQVAFDYRTVKPTLQTMIATDEILSRTSQQLIMVLDYAKTPPEPRVNTLTEVQELLKEHLGDFRGRGNLDSTTVALALIPFHKQTQLHVFHPETTPLHA